MSKQDTLDEFLAKTQPTELVETIENAESLFTPKEKEVQEDQFARVAREQREKAKRGRKAKIKTETEPPLKEENKEEKDFIFTYNSERYNHVEDNGKHYLLRKTKSDLTQLPLGSLGKFNGICFIGDPHDTDLNPGKRVDRLDTVSEKNTFMETVLNKLTQAILFCNTYNLLPICLGDLLHLNNLKSLHFNNHLIATLKLSKTPLLVNVGNHELSNMSLNTNNTLILLETAGVVRLMKENGLQGTALIDDERVLIGSVPYGHYIPYSLSGYFEDDFSKDFTAFHHVLTEKENSLIEKAKSRSNNDPITLKYTKGELSKIEKEHNELKKRLNVDTCILITHHDLAFTGYYPNCQPIQNIIGCDMVINGHIHDRKMPINLGKTFFFNTGNISRLSTDTFDHIPAIFTYMGKGKFGNNEFTQTIQPLTLKLIDKQNKTLQLEQGGDKVENFGYQSFHKEDKVKFSMEVEKEALFESVEEDQKLLKLENADINTVVEYRKEFYQQMAVYQKDKMEAWSRQETYTHSEQSLLTGNECFEVKTTPMFNSLSNENNDRALIPYILDYAKPDFVFYTGKYHTKREMLDNEDLTVEGESGDQFVSMIEAMDKSQHSQGHYITENLNRIYEANNVSDRIKNKMSDFLFKAIHAEQIED